VFSDRCSSPVRPNPERVFVPYFKSALTILLQATSPVMSLAQSSYPASAVTASSDPYRSTPTASPLPSPSLGAIMSRWKSVFRMGGKNGTIGMGTSSRPTILTGDGQEIPPESEFEEVSSELEPPKPTRLAATRANTEPAIHQVGDRDEEKEGTERSDSVGSSYQVHLGAQTGASLHPSTPVHEIARPMSSITTETTRSSQSSGSRNGPSSNPSPIHPQPPYAASSASLYTNASTSTTPHRNGLGMGFKSRIFSAPSSSDPSSSFLSMSSSSKKTNVLPRRLHRLHGRNQAARAHHLNRKSGHLPKPHIRMERPVRLRKGPMVPAKSNPLQNDFCVE